VKVKPIALLVMEDEAGEDHKVLSVPIKDPHFAGYSDLGDVNPHTLSEIREFFEVYKRLEPGKWVNFKAWEGAVSAKATVVEAIQSFKERFHSPPKTAT